MSISQELSNRVNHAKWTAMLELYKNICMNSGYIFGGAVRDYVKRTLAAKKFEKFCKLNSYNFKDCYNNKNVDLETYADRNLFPNDIDVYLYEFEFQDLINILQAKYNIRCSDSADINYFFENDALLADAIIFKRVYIDLVKHNDSRIMDIILKNVKYNFQIKIDFIIVKTQYKDNIETANGGALFPPFDKFDFTVNHLFMYNNNGDISIDVSKDILEYKSDDQSNIYQSIIQPLQMQNNKHEILKQIYSDIENSIADPIYPTPKKMFRLKCKYGDGYKVIPDSYRIHKMISKGYKLDIYRFLKTSSNFSNYNLTIIEPGNPDILDSPDKCIICFDELTNERRAIQYNGCCNAKFDLECFIRYIQNPQMSDNLDTNEITCPHCRTPFKNACICDIMQFIGILLHKFRVFNKEESCHECINSTCNKWIINCNCGDL